MKKKYSLVMAVVLIGAYGLEVKAGGGTDLSPRGGAAATAAAQTSMGRSASQGSDSEKKSPNTDAQWNDLHRNLGETTVLLVQINDPRFFQGFAYHSGWEDVENAQELLKAFASRPPLEYAFLTQGDASSERYAQALANSVEDYNELLKKFKKLEQRRNSLPKEVRSEAMFDTLSKMFKPLTKAQNFLESRAREKAARSRRRA